MVQPLIPYGIRGAIWYQGESNATRAAQYQQLFPAMIADWRQRFGQGDFPFYFVQLAPYRYDGNPPEFLAELWDAQVKTLATAPRTGMAIITDVSNVKDIHPKNKQDVGRRLALWALAKDYGKADVVYSGPIYDAMAVQGHKVRIKFKHAGGGLVAKDDKPLTHFTIAGADQKFYPATAIIDGETLVVSCDPSVVASPVAVRFAWSDTAEPNLCNKAGLPASPFRTDDFPLLTRDRK
jgi:sialate O-acetylesterase